MKKKISKKEAQKEIDRFFSEIKTKSSKDVKKIKQLAMRHNIKLREKRKLFCKKCLHPYIDPSIRIKKGKIRIVCANCGHKSFWKVE